MDIIPKNIHDFIDQCISSGCCVDNDLNLEYSTKLEIEQIIYRNSDTKARAKILRLLGYDVPKGYSDYNAQRRLNLIKEIKRYQDILNNVKSKLRIMSKYHPSQYLLAEEGLQIDFNENEIVVIGFKHLDVPYIPIPISRVTFPIDYLLIPEEELVSIVKKEHEEEEQRSKKLKDKFERMRNELSEVYRSLEE